MNLEKVISEFLTVLLVGTVPCVLSFMGNGAAGMVEFVTSLDTSDSSVYYALGLLGILVAISLFGKRAQWYRPTVRKRFKIWYQLANNVGGAFESICRVLSGFVLAIAILASASLNEVSVNQVVMFWIGFFLLFSGQLFVTTMTDSIRLVQRPQ